MADKNGECSKHLVSKIVVGHLTAFSHVFSTVPKVSFVELLCDQKVCFIALRHRKHMKICSHLILGQMYKFTNLTTQKMIYDDDKVIKVLETTCESIFILVLGVPRMVPIPTFDLINYEGIVTESCAALGLYKLHCNSQLCIAFLKQYSDVPLPCVGQFVSIYNAHSLKSESGDKHEIVLCGRSSIILRGVNQRGSNSQCILLDINLNWSYVDLLWMKKQLEQFEKKFTAEFLRTNSIVRDESVPELQQKILVKVVNTKYPVKEICIEKRYISREFVCSPHQCVITKPHVSQSKCTTTYLTLDQFWEQYTNSYSVTLKSWAHNIVHYTSGLVGLLSADPCNGYWSLSDATRSIPCLLTGITDNLTSFHGALVLLTQCSIVTETFQNGNVVYIHIAEKDIRILNNPVMKKQTCCRFGKDLKNVFGLNSEVRMKNNKKRINSSINAVDMTFTNKELGLRNSVKNTISVRSLVNEELTVPPHCTWLVVVHHKTPTVMINQNFPVCCVLISLVGRVHEIADGHCTTQRHFLLLSGKLLQFVPLMNNNTSYLLCSSSEESSQMFHQLFKMKSNLLPNVVGVCIPEDSIFCSVNTELPGFLKLKIDSYNVNDKKLHEEVGQKELIDVEGVICDRLHTDVKYYSEKSLQEIPGYGVPGMKHIVLKLIDPSSSYGEEVSLYLNNWSCRAYPFGLVPGAKICALFVAKRNSRNSNYNYFQATELTRIEVRGLPQSVEMNYIICKKRQDNWGECCILTRDAVNVTTGSMLWGSVSMVKILKLKVITSCSHCRNPLRNGCCNICSCYPPSAKLSATATCCMEDLFGKIIIIMKDEQVGQLLGLGEQEWNILTKLISLDGNDIELPQMEWNPDDPIGRRVLQSLLKTADRQKQRFHALFRKMETKKLDERTTWEEWPSLFCLALQEPNPELLVPINKMIIT